MTPGTNSDGTFQTITLEPNEDGSVTKTTTSGVDINHDNSELDPDYVITGETVEVIDGNPTDISGDTILTPADKEALAATTTQLEMGDFQGVSLIPDGSGTGEEDRSFDFSVTQSFGSAITAKLPIQFAKNIVQRFGTESTEAPVLYFNLPDVTVMGNVVSQPINSLDLSPFNIVAKALRWLLGLVIWAGAFKWIYSIVLGVS